ncbi:MAG: toll/interleukin-1 receptor domain-containing protein [Acidaminococcaceae bacterium]|nr:toll/interleukin-1 receptor domain-containing protein [Acidaminococcaceae bacterium]
MTFEEFIPKWYENHPLAKFDEDDHLSNKSVSDLITLIAQKLDWIQFCSENNINNIDDDFRETLFEDILQLLNMEAMEHSTISFGSLIDFFKSLSKEKADDYDLKLLSYVNELLQSYHSFEDFYHLYSAWTSIRIYFLKEVQLGFPAAEAGWMTGFYEARRQDFLKIREVDFPSMKIMGNYFLEMYASCKTIERWAMAGDIVKIHDRVVVFLRDLLVSARNNGYYDYEERIKEIIEEIKAETDSTPSVFISYTDSDKVITDQIEAAISNKARVHRDKHDVVAGVNLKNFMKSIRKQDFVILVVSDEYLQRRNCMYEVLQLLKDYEENEEAFWNKVKIFNIATGIHKGIGRAKKIKYWTDACNEIESKLGEIPEPASEGLVKEAKILRYISMEIDILLDHLNDEFCEKDLTKFIDVTNKSLQKWAQYGNNPYTDALLAVFQERLNSV